MKKSENSRNLAIFILILAIVFVICIANIIKLNVFALVLDVLLVIFVCFVLGYEFCKYENNESAETNEEIEEVTPNNEKTLSEFIEDMQRGTI
jgi:predicted membrane protein